MIKTYYIARPYHNFSFILRGKSGVKLRYDFKGGNTLTNTPARLTLHGQYAQELLECSEQFKTGLVKLERTTEGGEKPVRQKQPEFTVVESVDSPEKLIEFVVSELNKPYQQPKAALVFAEGKGYRFPNLSLEV